MNTETIKREIKRSYGAIAEGAQTVGCCSTEATCCITNEFGQSMTEDYCNVKGYREEADLALGCGIPTEIAGIQKGDTVLDLGSGAGNDAFIARQLVGEHGRVLGIDMTPQMVDKARRHAEKLQYKNMAFLLGEIEDMNAVASDTIDVVISNCVMNLVPDKVKAFREVFRVLKTGGHFAISDIVYHGNLPGALQEAAEMFAGCVAGASEKSAYLGIIKSAGFKNIQIKKERRIDLPDALLEKYMSREEIETYKSSGSGLYSITVYADKLKDGSCCATTESSCCGSSVG